MTGSERVTANNKSKHPKYLVYLDGRGKKPDFRNGITSGCLMKECVNDLIGS